MEVSLIIATNKWDGLDITFNHVKRLRTSFEWEFILVDEFKYSRLSEVKSFAEETGIKMIHVRPKEYPHGRFIHGIGNCLNTGLIYASGNITVFTEDFCSFKPDWLEKHLNFHNQHKGCCLTGEVYCYRYIPKAERLQVLTDIAELLPYKRGGPLPISSETVLSRSPYKYNNANASASLEAYLNVNGFSEAMLYWAPDGQGARMKIPIYMSPHIPVWHMNHGPPLPPIVPKHIKPIGEHGEEIRKKEYRGPPYHADVRFELYGGGVLGDDGKPIKNPDLKEMRRTISGNPDAYGRRHQYNY